MKRIAFVLSITLIILGCSAEEPNISGSAGDDTKSLKQVSRSSTIEEQDGQVAQDPKLLYPEMHGAEQLEMRTPPRPMTDIRYFKFLTAKKACEILARIFPEAVFAEGERADTVIVKARKDDLEAVRDLSAKIDTKAAQVVIESKVVEMTESGMKNMGLQWDSSSGTGGFRFSYDAQGSAIRSDSISAVLNALVASGKARIIASPSITTLDNTEASVNIGSRIPYAVPASTTSSGIQWTVQYIDAGVSLRITPKISAEKMISVEIHPEVSSVSQWRATVAGEFPVISTRNASAFVRVADGQTIVIAGLIDEKDRENLQKLPIAGDIPIISGLFSKKISEKERTEIIFMITPKIV